MLKNLARSLDEQHPGAAASLREGLEDLLTVKRLTGERDVAIRRGREMNGALPENAVLLSYHRSSSQDQRERGTHAGHLKALREDAEKHNWPLHRFEDLPVYKPDVKLSKGRVDGSVFVDETQTVLLEPEPNTHSLSAVLAPEPKKIHKCERSLTTARRVLHPLHALESCHVLTEEEVEDRLNTAPCEETKATS